MNRRWRVPPPPSGGLDAAVGAAVLEENAGSIGILLWDAARDVVLWSTSSRHELTELFAPAAERMRMTSVLTTLLDRKLESSLQALARLVGRPALANRERASMACREIAQWADDQGAIATAYAFAHAAALCCPGNARLSHEAGRLARRRAEYGTAEAWLARAVLLGRQSRDWESYGIGVSALANTFAQKGNFPQAKRYNLRCLRVARSYGLRSLEGDALHALCGIAIEGGQLETANSYAKEARVAYGENHPNLPSLAHDIAYAWMAEGYYRRALDVFEAVAPHFRTTARVAVLANICRAAAGADATQRFVEAWQDASTEIGRLSARDHIADALLELARGAMMFGWRDAALEKAQRALAEATERREAKVAYAAETLIETIGEEIEKIDAEELTSTTLYGQVDELADEFVDSLTGYAAAGV